MDAMISCIGVGWDLGAEEIDDVKMGVGMGVAVGFEIETDSLFHQTSTPISTIIAKMKIMTSFDRESINNPTYGWIIHP